jgi:N-acetylglucosamine-6-phosphate deacetylase
MILITDSVKALDRDEHDEDQIKGGVYRLRDGTIAGSQLTMIDSVRNAVRRLGIDLKDAIRFASLNPARLLGLDAQKGSISKGKDADIVIFDKDFNVKMTIVRGRIVYRKA